DVGPFVLAEPREFSGDAIGPRQDSGHEIRAVIIADDLTKYAAALMRDHHRHTGHGRSRIVDNVSLHCGRLTLGGGTGREQEERENGEVEPAHHSPPQGEETADDEGCDTTIYKESQLGAATEARPHAGNTGRSSIF